MEFFTEAQYPLDENHGIVEKLGQTFGVLVQWHDPAESPTQAVNRLNAEAIENADRAIAAEQDRNQLRAEAAEYMEGLDDYVIAKEHHDGTAREITHLPCGTVVGVLSDSVWKVRALVARIDEHDCSVEALVYATSPGKALATIAIGLLAGADTETCSPEYLRALAEMIVDATDTVPSERKQEVADFLWATAATTGDCPEI